ncbi:hypothetical protein K9M79_02785 [Candidatus Woesearchaeota archaeon]|nr:hypothetical protein [Candidatus Woesearchaeota archaeon]
MNKRGQTSIDPLMRNAIIFFLIIIAAITLFYAFGKYMEGALTLPWQ